MARLLNSSQHPATSTRARWQQATAASCDWSDTLSPQHFYLFSLKALSFILLRQQRRRESDEILAKLNALDPSDRSAPR